MSTGNGETSITLLRRIRDADDVEAWGRFVDRYGPCIYEWCRQRRLQEADAEDVTQEVLTRLVRRLVSFEYDPDGSFRGWLRRVAQSAIADLARAHDPGAKGSGDTAVASFLRNQVDREDLFQRLQGSFDQEILEEAFSRVSSRVEPHTWQAFHLVKIDRVPVREAADRLKMKVATLYVACSKVQKMLAETVKELERD